MSTQAEKQQDAAFRRLAEVTESLSSAQQRIEELERALGELVALDDIRHRLEGLLATTFGATTEMIELQNQYSRRRPGAWAAARTLVARAIGTREGGDAQAAPGRSPESAVATATRPSKGFLKGESPQATWPWDVASKSSEP